MTTSPKAARFNEDTLWVSLSDGRTIAAPLAWFPRLLEAAPEQRAQVELSKGGLYWDALDEDISIAGLLAGQSDISQRGTNFQSAIPVQSPPDAELDEQWVTEVDDRLTVYRRGEIQAVPLSEAIAKHSVGG
jgi:hypothetical protein